MKNKELVAFFELQRQIFGVCPNRRQIFRLSECQVYLRKKPELDWYKRIQDEQTKIDNALYKLEEKAESIREAARSRGRKQADRMISKVDTIFRPMQLNPDDPKVIFHPVDFIVFNGLKKKSMKNLVFMDHEKKSGVAKDIQRSIDSVIEKENYEWITLRVEENGNIKQE